MTLTFAAQVAVVWSLARIAVKDSVFEGTRRRFFRALHASIGGIGPGSAGDRFTLRALERRTKRSRDAQGMRRRARNMESQRAQRIGVRYRLAKESNAVTQYMWLLIGTVYTRACRNTVGEVFYGIVHLFASLARLLAEKIRDGSTCMFCVAIWVAAPITWIYGPPGWKAGALWWLGVSGAARMFMQLCEVLEGGD